MNIVKKAYEAPKMTVVDMKFQTSLLSCSGCEDGGPETDHDYDDEFGFIDVSGKNRQA